MEKHGRAQFDKAGGVKADRFDDRIPRCLNIVQEIVPTSILDVGCGDGFFLAAVRDRVSNATRLAGLEISSSSVQFANKRGLECQTWNAEAEFPFPQSDLDMVFAGEVIEHLVDPEALLREAHRVLKPHGYLLLTTPNLVAWFNRILVLAGITPMFVEHSYRTSYGPAYSLLRKERDPVGHLRIFTRTPLLRLLADNGFITKWVGASACLPVPVIHSVDKMVSRIYPRLGANIIVLAQKPR